jgi:DNA-binding transcriptional regulator LsrR (DeoR family)
MDQPTMTDYFSAQAFAARLTQLLEQRTMSQSRLAESLGVSRSTITGWLRYGKLPDAYLLNKLCAVLHCSADWLLGLATHAEKQDGSGGIRWIEQITPYIQEAQRAQIEYGIRLFNLLVVENRSAESAASETNWQTLRFAIQAALRSGAIRLVQVARNEAQETALKQRYPFLKAVIVADVPRAYDDTIIRTELVCFLAATEVLSRVIRPGAVGLGSGYTMLRLCEQSIPGIDPFSGTTWIPLLAFAPSNTTDYTANFLARLMSIRHPGSQAVYFPHPDECSTPAMQTVYQDTQRRLKNIQTMFLSVSGVDRRDRSGTSHLLAEFRSADYLAEAPELRSAYAQLDNKRDFGGELLRYLLDAQGKVILSDAAVGAQIDLEILRYNSTLIGSVCIIAARHYKARPVLMCLQNRLANSLVIDSEIAAYLLDHG